MRLTGEGAMVDGAAVREVVDELATMVGNDGAALRLASLDEASGRLEIELDLSGVDCPDCVLAPERLRDVVNHSLRERVTGGFTLVLRDPREPAAPASGGRAPAPVGETVVVLDPTAQAAGGDTDPGPDAGPLAGKTVGFRVDVLWTSWDQTVEEWTGALERAGAQVRSWRRVQGLTGEQGAAAQAEYEAFVAAADVVVSGLGNCGSCTSWSVRDALTGLIGGKATVCVATAQFTALARMLAADRGRPGLRLLELPYPYDLLPESEVRAHAQAQFPRLLDTLGASV
jgi:Fe-S cluster biogenesis protein NfuA